MLLAVLYKEDNNAMGIFDQQRAELSQHVKVVGVRLGRVVAWHRVWILGHRQTEGARILPAFDPGDID